MQISDFHSCDADMLSTKEGGIEFFAYKEDLNADLCSYANSIKEALPGKMQEICEYLEKDPSYIYTFGKLEKKETNRLLSRPQVYLFPDGGAIVWLGDNYAFEDMVSVNFEGVLERFTETNILNP